MDHRYLIHTSLDNEKMDSGNTSKTMWTAVVRSQGKQFQSTKPSEWLAIRSALNKMFNELGL